MEIAPCRVLEWRSPLGPLAVIANGEALSGLILARSPAELQQRLTAEFSQADPGKGELLSRAVLQLDEYFSGTRRDFTLPIDLARLTLFRRSVLATLAAVPYGASISYAQLAVRAGHAGAARAVGGAMAANPLPIIIPCHRVVGADGALVGYSGAGGLTTKAWLLAFERRQLLQLPAAAV